MKRFALGMALLLIAVGSTFAEDKIELTPANLARVIKAQVGPDAADVKVEVRRDKSELEFVLSGKAADPGVAVRIHRAIDRSLLIPGDPTFDDSKLVVPGRPGLLGACVPGTFELTPGRFGLSADGKRFAVLKGRAPKQIEVWDLPMGKPTVAFTAPPIANRGFAQLPYLALSPDGNSMAVLMAGAELPGGGRATAVGFLGEAANVKPVALDGKLDYHNLAVAPGGKAAAIGTGAGTIFLIKDGALTPLDVKPVAPNICRWGLAFSPDGKYLAIGEISYLADSVTVWDVAKGTELHRMKHKDLAFTCLAWFPDGKRLAVGAQDKDGVVVFDLAGGPARVMAGARGEVKALAVSPDGSRLAAIHYYDGAVVYDVAAGKAINAINRELSGEHAVAFADGGKTLVTGVARESEEVRRWNLAGGGMTAPAAGGMTTILGVNQRDDPAGHLRLTVEYRITGAADRDCVIVVNFLDAAGKIIPVTKRESLPMRRGPDGSLMLTAVVRPSAETENAYRILILPKDEVPAGALTAAIQIISGGRPLLEKPHLFEVKAK